MSQNKAIGPKNVFYDYIKSICVCALNFPDDKIVFKMLNQNDSTCSKYKVQIWLNAIFLIAIIVRWHQKDKLTLHLLSWVIQIICKLVSPLLGLISALMRPNKGETNLQIICMTQLNKWNLNLSFWCRLTIITMRKIAFSQICTLSLELF